MQNKKLIFTIIGGVILYLLSSGISFAAFRYLGKSATIETVTPQEETKSGFRFDTTAPKTESCPTSGEMFPKEARTIWEQHRPIAVMIENHADARPQSGLSQADVIYEAVAEGGITRFLGVYYCRASAQDIKLAPVRSSRIYFVEWASEYGHEPIYMHVGGANDYQHTGDTVTKVRALELLEKIGWRYRKGNDFDSTFDGQYPVFYRDYERLGREVATEHTMVSTTDRIWEEASKRGLNQKEKNGKSWWENFTPWKFKDEASPDKRGETNKIQVTFWSNKEDYDVTWEYNRDTNEYLRSNGGQVHKDLNNEDQLKAKNVVIQYMKEEGPLDRNKHMFYQTTGSGKALVFQDGQVLTATWSKKDREGRTKYTDSRGKEISFNRGQIWVETVPVGQEVSY